MSQHSADSTQIPGAPNRVDEATAALTPGALIRQAREASGMSLVDLAAHTRLVRPTLEALERDDYGSLLEPVYVRGYYRKIARVLKLDENLLLAAYARQEKPQEPVLPMKLRLASGAELGSGSRLPIAMASLLAVLAVVISGFLWLSRPQPAAVVMPDVAEVAVGSDTQPALQPLPTSEAVTPTIPDSTGPDSTGPDTMGTVSAESATATQQAAADAQPMASNPGAITPESIPESAPADALQLSFREDCWVRIDDANGKTLINELRRSGQNAVLSGALPLNVFLGNAPGVTLKFNGQPVDSTPYTRENKTARLRVPLE